MYNICDEKFKTILYEGETLRETQSVGIHDIFNTQGFVTHYRVTSNIAIIWKFSNVREYLTAKQKDGLTSVVMFNVLGAKIFQYDFLEGQCLRK